ncbi:ASCH domain-containing protein [Nocardiopsis sp. N85]|uniref:ASCH domain-containing protein n=1 Tax=Nocardiopsis sp. N85 TaxID=3029400 RepID=UPI00237F95A8|nr:ASCH domain-containing protein [Nocardiopsis sp. N85]MDE3722880.1 ASCH domain-containing protein [Nocardiopsis sp. N85]
MENAPVDRTAALRLWEEYRSARPALATDREPPSVERFGDHPALTDELLGLVLAGTKRATASLLIEFAAEGAPAPGIGGHWIACDSTGRPRAVLRTTGLRLGVFGDADEAFARDEGEDDLSLASWREGHRRYWTRLAPALGATWTEEHEIVFEHFSVVWPPEVADR